MRLFRKHANDFLDVSKGFCQSVPGAGLPAAVKESLLLSDTEAAVVTAGKRACQFDTADGGMIF